MFLLLISGFLIILSTFFIRKHMYSYWKNKGIYQLEPGLTGNFNFNTHISVQMKNIYAELKSKGKDYGGIYILTAPALIPVNIDFLKTIMVKDFGHFMNHSSNIANEYDPLNMHLFNLADERWKEMRVKLTPTFTSGKMKLMFQTFVDCTENLKDNLDQSILSGKSEVDIKDTLARFTTDIIASCGFGVECNSLKNPDAEFRKYGKKIFEPGRFQLLKFRFVRLCPKPIARLLKIQIINSEVHNFFMKTIQDIVNYREKHNIYRKDFMHLLLQLKNIGKLSDDEKIKVSDNINAKPFLNINELAAQCFVFFAAGFETSSTVMTFALYELARNPDLQEKLRSEINEVLQKHNNSVTYESVMDMKYLDQVINESLRRYPPVGAIPRECSKTYKIDGTNDIIEKGTRLFIPVLGIHMDEEYYPNPEKFDPDRFSEENKAKRPAFSFIPFGEGPRLCIGLRFGLLQSKVGLLTIIRNYRISISPKTQEPLILNSKAFVTAAEGDIWLKLTKL